MKKNSRLIALLTLPITTMLFSSGACASPKEVDVFEMSLEQLMDIKVTSVSKREEKASEAASAIYVVTNEDIRRSGATSIPEALRGVPGLQVSQTDSNKWAISARGFNRQFSNKLLVLIDGRSVYTPLFSGVLWDEQDVPLEDIERIEVIRGPGATLWGANAVNGVINIITKRAEDTQGTMVSGGYGNHETGFGTARYGGKIGESTHYRAYTKYNDRNSFDKAAAPRSDNRDDWSMGRAGFRIDSDKNSPDSITFQGDIYRGDETQVALVPTLTAPFITTLPDEDTDFSGANLVTRWNHKISSTSSTSLQVYYDFIERNIPVLNQRRHTFDVDFQHNLEVNSRNQITWGVGLRHISDSLGDTPYLNYDDDDQVNKVFSSFVQDKITLSPEKLFLTIGSKFEHNEYTGFEFQPNIRGSWIINDKQNVWASVSRAVRMPTRAENNLTLAGQAFPAGFLGAGLPGGMVNLSGNTNVESEDVVAYEIGYRIEPRNDVSIDATAFYNDYANLDSFELTSPTLNTTGPFTPPYLDLNYEIFNNNYGESYGFELATNWQAKDWWKLSANYAFITLDLHTKPGHSDIFFVADEGRTPKNTFSLGSHMNLPHNVEFDNFLYYVDNLSTVNIDNYIRFDTRVGWKPMDGVELSLVGQNLFDDHQEFDESLYSTPAEIGRTYYGKVTFRY